MGNLTEFERERLEAQALAQAAQNQPSHAIVVVLREYSLEYGLDVSDGELFVIAELARARQASLDGSPATAVTRDLPPRSLRDRRKRERRKGPRRSADRRRTGLSAAVEALRRIGQPERRSGRDRRARSDRRALIRRRRIRRQDQR